MSNVHATQALLEKLNPAQNIVGFNYPFAKALLEKLESLIGEMKPTDHVVAGDIRHAVSTHLHNQIFQHPSSGYYNQEELLTLISTVKEFLAIFENKSS